MKMGEFLLGDAEVQKVGAGEELNIFPRDELVGKVVGEKQLKQFIHALLPSHPSHQAAKTHIHMDQPEVRIDPEKMKIIDPNHLCTVGVHDLFIHDLFPEKNTLFLRETALKGPGILFGRSDFRLETPDFSPGEIEAFPPSSGSKDQTDHHRISLSPLCHQVYNPAHPLAGGIKDFAVQEFTEKIEILEGRNHENPVLNSIGKDGLTVLRPVTGRVTQ
jgi:hypothetical protein